MSHSAQLLKCPVRGPGFYPLVSRGHGLEHLSFAVLELGPGYSEHRFETAEEELALAFYSGPVTVDAEGSFGSRSAEVPARPSLGQAHQVLYLPAGAQVRLRAPAATARVTISGALGRPGLAPLLTGPCLTDQPGRDHWGRTVWTYISDNVDARHLVVGETLSQAGGWTSFPPHKHDRFAGGEVPMEEIYYFRCVPAGGFGMIRVYTDADDPAPFDHAFAIEDGDTVLIPRGYHPVSASPGYQLHYTWILAGHGRTYGAWRDDPRHAWIKSA